MSSSQHCPELSISAVRLPTASSVSSLCSDVTPRHPSLPPAVPLRPACDLFLPPRCPPSSSKAERWTSALESPDRHLFSVHTGRALFMKIRPSGSAAAPYQEKILVLPQPLIALSDLTLFTNYTSRNHMCGKRSMKGYNMIGQSLRSCWSSLQFEAEKRERKRMNMSPTI